MGKLRSQKPSQLTQLIWDFYRENQQELDQLRCLSHCQVVRRWGVLHIRCPDQTIVNAVLANRALLEVPLAKLRVVQRIKIFILRNPITSFTIGSDKQLA
ncbi:hypothetical protein PN441_13270 [Spirulina major CS-329]|uniref:hypothetical protein n=1 Tax=Spirulina TaxID=1154 RepID=UPI00232E1BD9|nr:MULTISPECIES: hypothetical protein [Spirulina]MDB9493373.1 hypothetical protein [Spirulina subsalsa CS-330]MDB9504040.1 hypothetical protein [Spirulina major CS-329]